MVQVYDTTLRDGSQRTDVSFSCDDKLRIAKKLDDLGVDFIEGGWPGSNPKDVEFFERARKLEWKHAVITSFGSTCRKNKAPKDDENIQALLNAGTEVCTIFGKTWTLHVTDVIQTTLENNLLMIEQSVAYLRSQGRRVIYDAEHFFDGFKADPDYAVETLKAAERGGAESLVLCDTNGGTMPWELVSAIKTVQQHVQTPLGIHAHNDSESAVVNSLMAVKEGCVQVQGTINGYGERCGNANLCSVIPNLELKMGERCLHEGSLKRMAEVSNYVSELANLPPDEHLAYVGKSAFAHKGGVHVAAIRRNVNSYQHIDPELVGNQIRVVVSELSGRGNLLSKLEEYDVDGLENEQVVGVLNDIKDKESEGFLFEGAEASVMLMLNRQKNGYKPPFEMVDFSTTVQHRDKRGVFSEATVKVRVGDELMITAAEGNGPVNALDYALRKALENHFPQINKFYLADYKVRILDGSDGTGASIRVLIDTQNGTRRWSTVGASTNIIEASWRALADSFEYGLQVVGE